MCCMHPQTSGSSSEKWRTVTSTGSYRKSGNAHHETGRRGQCEIPPPISRSTFSRGSIAEGASLSWIQEGFTVEPLSFDSGANFQWNDSDRERKLNPNFFFSNFSGAPGISRQNPGISRQKSLISLVSRGIPNFLAPTPSCGRPLPRRKISGLKSLDLGSFFVPEIQARKSELQAESRSYGQEVRVTARQTARIRTESPSLDCHQSCSCQSLATGRKLWTSRLFCPHNLGMNSPLLKIEGNSPEDVFRLIKEIDAFPLN